MTVSTTKAEQVYTGNGATTSFATNFKLLDASHIVVKIRVIATGVETTQTLDTDYSVSNIGNDSGATVTYPVSGSALPATEQIVLVREVPFTQSTSIKNQTGFFPSVLENAYDLIVMMAQQVRAKTDRALRFAIGSTFNAELPTLDGNRTLITNSGGTAFAQGPTADEISGAQASATAAASSASDAANSATAAATFDPANFQPKDSNLTSLAGLTLAADKGLYATGAGTLELLTITAQARILLEDVDAVGQRATLQLGGLATEYILDQDDFSSNSATRPPSQQSVAAYIAAQRFTSTAQTITAGGLVTIAHGLGATPRFVTLRVKCTAADAGYAIGDEIIVSPNGSSATDNRYTTPRVDSTNVYVRFSNDTFAFAAGDKGTGAISGLTNSKWELYVEAMI